MPQFTIQQAFELASQHHQAGRLKEAEQLYRQILIRQPEHVGALHYLGVLAHQGGQNEVAVDLIRKAIVLDPKLPELHNNLGLALKELGQLDQAIAVYRQALSLRPNYPSASYNLGIALSSNGQPDDAIAAYREAISRKPDYVGAYNNLGHVLKDKGRLEDAIAAFHQAIARAPGDADIHFNLGNALKDRGQVEEAIASYRGAIACRPDDPAFHYYIANALQRTGDIDGAIAAYRQAIALDPSVPEVHNNLGAAFKENGDLESAIAACRDAIALNPNYAHAYNNLGAALKSNGQTDKALVAFRQAVAADPNLAEAHNNLGNSLNDIGQKEEAFVAYRQAISLKPDYAYAHNNLGYALLSHGLFDEGWQELEWRLRCNLSPFPRQDLIQPQWDGRRLEGKTILLQAEQGFGDTIQFIRFFHLVARRGGRIVIECQTELQRLFQISAHGCQIVARDQPLPAFQVHCPLLSLPRLFDTTLTNIPNAVPYLHADAQDTKSWQRRLSDLSPAVNVGLTWAGDPRNPNDRIRSMKLASLGRLGQIPSVRLFSLQKGDAADQARLLLAGMNLIDWTSDVSDFADTAAFIANLDLIITIDTVTAHLAGALGRTVWVLLPFNADWRWLAGREKSPWYPTMRLFRQTLLGDWDDVVRNVAEALSLWMRNRR